MNRRFSQRIGVAAEPTTIQLDSMDEPLRNSLWNKLHNTYNDTRDDWRYCAKFSAQYFF